MNGWLKAMWLEMDALFQMNEAWRFAVVAICLLAALLFGWLVRRALLAVATKHAARPALAARPVVASTVLRMKCLRFSD